MRCSRYAASWFAYLSWASRTSVRFPNRASASSKNRIQSLLSARSKRRARFCSVSADVLAHEAREVDAEDVAPRVLAEERGGERLARAGRPEEERAITRLDATIETPLDHHLPGVRDPVLDVADLRQRGGMEDQVGPVHLGGDVLRGKSRLNFGIGIRPRTRSSTRSASSTSRPPRSGSPSRTRSSSSTQRDANQCSWRRGDGPCRRASSRVPPRSHSAVSPVGSSPRWLTPRTPPASGRLAPSANAPPMAASSRPGATCGASASSSTASSA